VEKVVMTETSVQDQQVARVVQVQNAVLQVRVDQVEEDQLGNNPVE
jgi:hypothetical protein